MGNEIISQINTPTGELPSGNIEYKEFAKFVTEDGHEAGLYTSIRDKIKPGWESFYDLTECDNAMLFTDRDNIMTRKKSVEVAILLLKNHNIDWKDKDILEIGCYDGLQSYVAACYKPKSVLGIDVNEYGVRQSMNMDADMNRKWIRRMRRMTKAQFPENVGRLVSFDEVDATKMDYDEEFDIIFSFDTLEHLIPPKDAFKCMYRALKKGGGMFHSYNPFFALNGGHSPCTLDFLWGHCSLSEKDVEKYINIFRAGEAKTAIPFFKESLNRMTLKDMEDYCKEIGFRILYMNLISDFFRNKEEETKIHIEKDYLPFVVKHYPSATVRDLLYDHIEMVMVKE